MIYGIGTDIVQIQRIERLHEKYGERFVERLLLPSEADAFRGQSRPGRFLAMRFAAQEGNATAMGTGGPAAGALCAGARSQARECEGLRESPPVLGPSGPAPGAGGARSRGLWSVGET